MHSRYSAFIWGFVVLSLVSGLTGCSSYKPPPTYPMEDKGYTPGGVMRNGVENDPPIPLSLLPGDTIDIIATSTESTTYSGLVVDGEGKVHVPIAGAIQVSGLSPQQSERKIEEAMQKFDRFVRVSVLVTGQGGHYATVIGAVVNEGQIPLTPGMRVAELIAAAGGPLRSEVEGEINYIADLDEARLVRNSVPLPVSIRLALAGDPKHNVIVHPTDQLFMPAGLGSRIAVLGIGTIGGTMIPYRHGIRLSEALATAGSFTILADLEDIRLLRGPIKTPLLYQYDFKDFINGETGDVELAPGDVVFVSTHWSAKMGEVLSRVTPLLNVLITATNTYFLVENLNNSNKK
ncbi:MAG: polysaccharide biosynthesis/export family protein [Myxococcales bacterium]